VVLEQAAVASLEELDGARERVSTESRDHQQKLSTLRERESRLQSSDDIEPSNEAMPRHRDLVCEVAKTSVSPHVDLDKVRAAEGDYLSLLSANTRQQVRRAIRLFESKGELILERAPTAGQALDWFERLCHLHQERWTARGKPGAYPAVAK